VFAAFKDVADRKDEVDDRDLMAIISEHTSLDVDELWKLDLVQVSTTDHGRPTATVRLVNSSDEVFEDAAVGEGPVDAIYNAVNRVTGAENTLTEYSVKSVTEGIDAQGEVTIRIESNGHSYMGRAADPDILVASTRAYIYAMNRSLNDQMAS
jgi:2-isopropylmalate synthase